MEENLGAALAQGVPGVRGVPERKSVGLREHLYRCVVFSCVPHIKDRTADGAAT